MIRWFQLWVCFFFFCYLHRPGVYRQANPGGVEKLEGAAWCAVRQEGIGQEERKGLESGTDQPYPEIGAETWGTKKTKENRLDAEMRMLFWADGHTLMDHVENTEIRKRMKVTELHQNEKRLRWYGHVMERSRSNDKESAPGPGG